MKNTRTSLIQATAIALPAAAACGSAAAQSQTNTQPASRQLMPQERTGPTTVPQRADPTTAQPGIAQEGSDAKDAATHLNRAIAVIHQMGRKRDLAALLAKSKGVFVVPDSVRVVVGVGARGGAGVLLVRRADGWGTPAFYNMAGVTLGAQLGAEGGATIAITDIRYDGAETAG